MTPGTRPSKPLHVAERVDPTAAPFAGIEIVEFGQFIAVPYCGQLFADGGAHVLKVEPLEGEPVRAIAPLAPGESRHFIARNRGKHSLPLDLRHPRAAPVIDALVAQADVVLTNLRPGLAAQLGLDWATLHAKRPRLILGNVTGFGLEGPDAGLPAMDMVIQARSGLMAAAGRIREGVPQATEPPIADYLCACALAFGVASALVRRTRTGRGGEVNLSLLMAALVLQNNAMMRVHAVDGPRHETMREDLAELRAAGAPYEAQSAVSALVRPPALVHVYYRSFATRDAAVAIACVSPQMQKALARAVGFTDEGVGLRTAGDRAAEARYYEALGARVEATMRERPATEWKAIFDAHGIPASEVRMPFEMLDDPQVLVNRMLHDLPHPLLGPVRVLGTPIGLDGDGFVPAPATPPFGSETRALLAGLGLSDADVDGLIADGVTRERPSPAS